ncbi:Crp/Fnr family transcriptional regulator [Crenothrix polyspora]|uniref:Transcriptional regulator, Crp/Fnr family n=1 Tax=Crenothrix polyspora TaxID=360316 RepID=A0A1R4HF12_9GAMM|nr:Crp/Fnr family transcriptional regulator [Crenothrix polyspora]SJM94799.1 Transcriptional regulator, Crp/Fnr family [Crenothrix polyspora]
MQSEVYSGLKKIPFLATLPSDALQVLASKAKAVKFLKQEVIITEGDETHSLYIILSGKVRVFSTDNKSKEVTLLIQETGSYFGEIALLSDEPRSASVLALEKTLCGIISKHDFIQWLTLHPEVAISLLGVLSEKIRALTQKVKQLALSNVYERTIKVLNDMARPYGDMYIITARPTQYELATMVGSSREMINKIMQELVKGGYIILEEKTLIIEKKLPASW